MCFLPAGYRVATSDTIAIEVPYVVDDHEGKLTNALAYALSTTAQYRYVQKRGDWVLKVAVLSDKNDRIGYRYDRNPVSGKLKESIAAAENRKHITAEVKVIKASTGELVLGPQKIKVSAAYDYDDPSVLFDLAFTDPQSGATQPLIDVSLGQLDSVAAAGENAVEPIYKELAQRIIEWYSCLC